MQWQKTSNLKKIKDGYICVCVYFSNKLIFSIYTVPLIVTHFIILHPIITGRLGRLNGYFVTYLFLENTKTC